MSDKTIEQEVSELIDSELSKVKPNIPYLESMIHGYIRLARMEGQNIQLKKELDTTRPNKLDVHFRTVESDDIFKDLANYFKPIK